MNILICGSKVEKVNIQQLFNGQVKKTFKNFIDCEEYTYYYDWKFDFFKEGLRPNQLNKVYSKLEKDFKDFRDLIFVLSKILKQIYGKPLSILLK